MLQKKKHSRCSGMKPAQTIFGTMIFFLHMEVCITEGWAVYQGYGFELEHCLVLQKHLRCSGMKPAHP